MLADVHVCGRYRFADVNEGFALERNQMGHKSPSEGVQATYRQGETNRADLLRCVD